MSETLRSGWITSGPRVAAFEEEFSRYVSAPFGVAVTSATAGFHILLQALGIGSGDEVITPPLTWPSPVNMAVFVGARPVFADIDRRTFQLDPASVERVLTPQTKANRPGSLRWSAVRHGIVAQDKANFYHRFITPDWYA